MVGKCIASSASRISLLRIELPQISPSRENWLCYILRCADGTLYTGITNDLEKRLAAHHAGGTKYTRARGPLELVFVENHAGKSSALKREMQIKHLSRSEKLTLIESAARR